MENLFDKIIENNNNKVKILCKKLRKKLSFKSGKDVENLCHLIYWLYILNEIELGKQCIGLTHEIVLPTLNLPFFRQANKLYQGAA